MSIADKLRASDAAITGTILARIGNPEIARLVVNLKAAAQEAAHVLDQRAPAYEQVATPEHG